MMKMKTKIIAIAILLSITLFNFNCVNVFKYSDLRTEGYVYPHDLEKAKQLLQDMAVEHRNHLWDSIQTYQVNLEEESFGFFGKKSSPFKELSMRFSLHYIPKTQDGLLEILSGEEQGQFWGVHQGKTYQRVGDKIVLAENEKYHFSINTFQYFIELPNRITEGNVIDYLGQQVIDGTTTEGVIVSWNTIQPQKDIDQFVLWLDANSKRIVRVDYTIREKFRFVKGQAYYKDYKDFNGFLLPSVIASKSNIKKKGYIHVKKINSFTPNTLTSDYLSPLQ